MKKALKELFKDLMECRNSTMKKLLHDITERILLFAFFDVYCELVCRSPRHQTYAMAFDVCMVPFKVLNKITE